MSTKSATRRPLSAAETAVRVGERWQRAAELLAGWEADSKAGILNRHFAWSVGADPSDPTCAQARALVLGSAGVYAVRLGFVLAPSGWAPVGGECSCADQRGRDMCGLCKHMMAVQTLALRALAKRGPQPGAPVSEPAALVPVTPADLVSIVERMADPAGAKAA